MNPSTSKSKRGKEKDEPKSQTRIDQFLVPIKTETPTDDTDSDEDMELQGSQPGSSMGKLMPSYLSNSFRAITKEDRMDKANAFVEMLPGYIPDVATFQSILFKMMADGENGKSLKASNLNARRVLDINPPCNKESRNYYSEVFFLRSEFKDRSKWDILFNMMGCCLKLFGIEDDRVLMLKPCDKYCVVVLQFIVDVLKKDLDEFIAARAANSKAQKISDNCLVGQLFWPNLAPDATPTESKPLRKLLHCIDALFSEPSMAGIKLDFFMCLVNLLDLAMKLALFQQKCTKVEILKKNVSEPVQDLQKEFYLCKYIVTSRNNLTMFFSGITTDWLKIKLCDSLMSNLIYDSSHMCYETISLRKIVFKYMFPELNETANEKSENIGVDNALHDACANDLPGTMTNILKEDTIDINAYNSKGSTAIHIACEKDKFLVAHVLCRGKSGKLPDFQLRNAAGDTPLHIAVQKNNIDCVKLLLDKGGKSLLMLKNAQGQTAQDIASTKKMDLFLKTEKSKQEGPEVPETPNEVVLDIANITAEMLYRAENLPPVCRTAEGEIYLFCLQLFLIDYIAFFQLQGTYIDDEAIQKSYVKYFKCNANDEEIAALKDDTEVLQLIHSNMLKFYELFTKMDDLPFKVDDFLVGFTILNVM